MKKQAKVKRLALKQRVDELEKRVDWVTDSHRVRTSAISDEMIHLDSRLKKIEGAPEMTLRDWFAGLALAAEITRPESDQSYQGIARNAYDYADAMMEERKKGGAE